MKIRLVLLAAIAAVGVITTACDDNPTQTPSDDVHQQRKNDIISIVLEFGEEPDLKLLKGNPRQACRFAKEVMMLGSTSWHHAHAVAYGEICMKGTN